MADEECAHCGTLITEWSSVQHVGGKVFCCRNCSTAYTRAQKAPSETPMAMPPKF